MATKSRPGRICCHLLNFKRPPRPLPLSHPSSIILTGPHHPGNLRQVLLLKYVFKMTLRQIEARLAQIAINEENVNPNPAKSKVRVHLTPTKDDKLIVYFADCHNTFWGSSSSAGLATGQATGTTTTTTRTCSAPSP